MISPRQAAGLAPMSADFVVQQLKDAPDIDVVRTIAPPRLLGLQSDGASGIGSIVVARMNFDKARQLRNQAGARLVVEHDAPLTFGLDTSFADAKVTNPGVLVPLGDGFQTTIEVLGDEGPLAEAEVYLFGSVWPTQGVTDRTGRVTLTITGEIAGHDPHALCEAEIKLLGFLVVAAACESERRQFRTRQTNRLVSSRVPRKTDVWLGSTRHGARSSAAKL